MAWRAFSSLRILAVLGSIVLIVMIYLNFHPTLNVTPTATAGSGEAFGTTFNLKNESIAPLYTLTSSFCINSLKNPDGTQPPPNSSFTYRVPGQSVGLADLARGDTATLPIERVFSGPPGSQADIVFILQFQPGWSFDPFERRFRFQGKENQDATWTWKQVPLGSPCG